jgi:DNA repair ATPase RecN
MVAILGMAFTPTSSALALSPGVAPTPPAPDGLRRHRLEFVWDRQKSIYARMAEAFDRAPERISSAQQLIDHAKAAGKDVASLQAALDRLADAVQAARPIFESAKGLIASHPGFDADGHVTDALRASQTIGEMGDKLRSIREPVAEAARQLREAIQAFRQANRPFKAPTATPSS